MLTEQWEALAYTLQRQSTKVLGPNADVTVRLLLFCDALDELQGDGSRFHNLRELARSLQEFSTKGLAPGLPGRLKTVITYRESVLAASSVDMKSEFSTSRRRVFRPFGAAEVESYLRIRIDLKGALPQAGTVKAMATSASTLFERAPSVLDPSPRGTGTMSSSHGAAAPLPGPIGDSDAPAGSGLGAIDAPHGEVESSGEAPPDRRQPPGMLAAEEYLAVIHSSASLEDMTKNPFLLDLFFEALPRLKQNHSELTHVTRYHVIDSFVQQGFDRELDKKIPSGEGAVVGDNDLGDAQEGSVVSMMELLFALLAGEMLKSGVLLLFEEEQEEVRGAGSASQKVPSWKAVQDLAHDWLISADWRRDVLVQYEALPLLRRGLFDTAEDYLKCRSRQRLKPLRQALAHFESRPVFPIRRVGGATASASFQFAHKSFFEYFCARLLVLAGGDQLVSFAARKQRVASVLSIKRRIQLEPEVLRLLADHWHAGLQQGIEVRLARDCLFGVVTDSSVVDAPDSGALVSGTGVRMLASEDGSPSANAATVLNWMGEPMIRKTWDGVVLHGADLTRAVLIGTSLRGANLRGVRLEKAVLRKVDLTGANLSEADLGERAPLDISAAGAPGAPGAAAPGAALCAIAYVAPGIVAVGGTLVRIWDLVTRQTVGQPLQCKRSMPALGAKVTCLTAAPWRGRRILAAACGPEVWLWDTVSGSLLCQPLASGASDVNCMALAGVQLDGADVLVLVSGDTRGSVRRWCFKFNGSAVSTEDLPVISYQGPVTCVSMGTHNLLLDGERESLRSLMAAVANNGMVRVWELWTGDLVGDIVTSVDMIGKSDETSFSVTCVAMCELRVDGASCLFLACGASNGSMGVWNVEPSPFVKVTTWRAHDDQVNSVAMCDGK